MRTFPWMVMVVVVAAAGAAACGQGRDAADRPDDARPDGVPDGDPPDTGDGAPTVTATAPADGATGVDPGATVEVTFSESMDASTIDASTVVVTREGDAIAGTVTYDVASRVATFDPAARLPLRGQLTATVTTGVTDAEGTALAGARSWSFTVRDGAWGAAGAIEGDDTLHGVCVQVVADAVGRATAVWMYDDGTRQFVSANRYAETWGDVTRISGPIERTGCPQLAVDAAGAVTAVWEEAGAVWASRHADDGWATAAPITSGTTDLEAPDVAAAPSGDVMVVWSERPGGSRHDTRALHRAAGGTWGAPFLLGHDQDSDDHEPPEYEPHVAAGADDDFVALWAQSVEAVDRSVWARRFDGTAWAASVQLAAEPAYALNGGLDAAGRALAVWTHPGLGVDPPQARTASSTSDDGWSEAAALDVHDDLTAWPRLAVAPSGEAVAVWIRGGGGGTPTVWARRFVGGAWSGPVQVSTGAGWAHTPQVAIDAAGHAIAVWSELDDDGGARVWTSRGAHGEGWTAPAALSGEGRALGAQIAVDGSGHATAAWLQMPSVEPSATYSVWASAFR